MTLAILHRHPPNYSKILKAFPHIAQVRGVMFCYGDTIYSPYAGVTPPLMAHEEVHYRQQGDDPEAWWDRYLVDKEFRLDQELEAHLAEYEVYKTLGNRHDRRGAYKVIAGKLCSPIYGSNGRGLVTKAEARRLLSA